MKPRLSIFAAPVAMAIVSLFTGCSGEDGPTSSENTGGSSAGGAGPAPGGFGGLNSGGLNAAAGFSGGGLGGLSTGGIGNGGSSSAGGSGMGNTAPASFEALKFVIERAPCFGAGCHNDDQNPLDLRVDDQLYNRVTSRISTSCGGIPVVNPGRPQESALVKILKGPCGETQRMPPGCVDDQDALCVPPEYIEAIEQWIAMGAPQQ